MGAQELVQSARGRLIGKVWSSKSVNADENDDEGPQMASVDDISVMVVPLYPYLCEHKQWLVTTEQEKKYSMESSTKVVDNNTIQVD